MEEFVKILLSLGAIFFPIGLAWLIIRQQGRRIERPGKFDNFNDFDNQEKKETL
jgi:hypothetical protein